MQNIGTEMFAIEAYRRGVVYMSFFRKKWKMHLYLNGIYVGKCTIRENEEPSKNVYIVNFWFKNQILSQVNVRKAIR